MVKGNVQQKEATQTLKCDLKKGEKLQNELDAGHERHIGYSEDYCGTFWQTEWLRGLLANFDMGDDGGMMAGSDSDRRNHIESKLGDSSLKGAVPHKRWVTDAADAKKQGCLGMKEDLLGSREFQPYNRIMNFKQILSLTDNHWLGQPSQFSSHVARPRLFKCSLNMKMNKVIFEEPNVSVTVSNVQKNDKRLDPGHQNNKIYIAFRPRVARACAYTHCLSHAPSCIEAAAHREGELSEGKGRQDKVAERRQAEDTGWAKKSPLPSLRPIYFHACHSWHLYLERGKLNWRLRDAVPQASVGVGECAGSRCGNGATLGYTKSQSPSSGYAPGHTYKDGGP
ncbi:hypothetical protein GGX14DRAFT_652318 [Mycena pura]|uniref:Uncharacterized protein n=1 Tax=Mycena pura TaxID=153505 RepID=A0AAD6V993_9AGAR|nr:hypothetical protein GGX14DRAFT_652318 [Mycena pura]